MKWSKQVRETPLGDKIFDQHIILIESGVTTYSPIDLANERAKHIRSILNASMGTHITSGGPVPVYKSAVSYKVVDVARHDITLRLVALDTCQAAVY